MDSRASDDGVQGARLIDMINVAVWRMSDEARRMA